MYVSDETVCCSRATDLFVQKKLGPSIFKIGCAQAAKNKWVEMGKQMISRKVRHFHFVGVRYQNIDKNDLKCWNCMND